MCSNTTYTEFRRGKHLSDTYPFLNGLKQWDALSLLLFKFALEYAINKVQKMTVGHINFYSAVMITYWSKTYILTKNYVHVHIPLPQCRKKSQIKIANKPSENVTKFRLAHFVTTPTNGSHIQEDVKSRQNSENACYSSLENASSPYQQCAN
jgi:hypothetical protein